MPHANATTPRRFFGLSACFLTALFALAYPLYVIRPFRFQGAHELSAALTITRVRPYLQALLACAAVWIAIQIWQHSRRWTSRTAATLLTLLTLACAVLSRVNVYEIMFHPLTNPSFIAAGKAKLDAKEQVIAIKVANAARAYPIRNISYHHIVNDVLAGLPVVATY